MTARVLAARTLAAIVLLDLVARTVTARALAAHTLAAIVLLALAAACTPRERTVVLTEIDQGKGYRYGTVEQTAPKQLKSTFVAMSFSGGGTRAAALAHGALQALADTSVPVAGAETRLADEIDIISSVSGGSVTAAYYALAGRPGLPAFERDFLKRDVQGELIWQALNPATWARLATPSYARIDVLRDYFDENVFAGATYQDLLRATPPAPRRPYVVLNAADMAAGAVFSFTQDQFDLLCADLAQLKLADAVAASAAFPVALTALTLKNRSPCEAQREAPRRFVATGWRETDGHPRPLRVTNDLDSPENPGRFRRGRTALSYLNEDGQTEYVHLLDGGIADNLGLSEPLALITSADRTPSIRSRINTGSIERLMIVVVNARSESDTDIGKSATPPGMLATLGTTIGTPINSASFQLIDSLDRIIGSERRPRVQPAVVTVDFDYLADAECRRRFKNLATSWALDDKEVDALVALGGAMVRESAVYQELVAALGGRVAAGGPTVAQACTILAPETKPTR